MVTISSRYIFVLHIRL